MIVSPCIVVLEDDPETREEVRETLDTEGFRTLGASSGAELWAHASSEPIQLFLLDLKLPGESGLSIAKDIRRTSDVGIIIVTGKTGEIDRVVGLELGADDYITKPFSPRELLARVRSVLRRTKGQVFSLAGDTGGTLGKAKTQPLAPTKKLTNAARRSNALPAGYTLHWYEIESVLGKGGFAITYAGKDTNLDHAVAIKEYFPHGYASRDGEGGVHAAAGNTQKTFNWGLTRFIDEAQTLARLSHPNIIRVVSVFEANGTAYMVMELETGFSLGYAIRFQLIKDERTLLTIAHALLDGLEYIHQAGFIHRDVKPDNIMLRDDWTPILLDFGSARQAMGDGTQQLTSVVSRGFAPFEQYDVAGGEVKQGAWSDIYSLAATLCSVITGRPPPDALTRGSALLSGADDPIEPVAGTALGRYSIETFRAIDKALAFNAEARPQSIAEWRKLFPLASSSPTPATVPDTLSTEKEWPATVKSSGLATLVIEHESRISRGASRAATPSAADAEPDIAALRFLLVDHEPLALDLTKRVVSGLGAREIISATNGREALDYLDSTSEAADIILCDFDMPGMGGVDLLRQLGERRITAGIVMVGGGDEQIVHTAARVAKSHDLYVLGHISKPIEPPRLKALLESFARTRTTSTTRTIRLDQP